MQIKDDLKLKNGDKLVITRGDGKFFQQGKSNNVRVEILKDLPNVRGGSDTLKTSTFSRGQINLDTYSCATCYNCVSTCPHDIWEISKTRNYNVAINEKNTEQCSLDMECVQKCPTGAIEIIANES